jgi:hypothetical protein
MNDKEERRDGRRSSGDRSKRPERGGQRPKAGASAEADKPRQDRKPSGGPRIEARQDRGGAESKERQEQLSKGQKGKRQDPRQQPAAAAAAQTHPRGGNRHRKAHTNQPAQTIQPRGKTIIKPVQPEVVPNSFLGIFKKIFALFFGKKK